MTLLSLLGAGLVMVDFALALEDRPREGGLALASILLLWVGRPDAGLEVGSPAEGSAALGMVESAGVSLGLGMAALTMQCGASSWFDALAMAGPFPGAH